MTSDTVDIPASAASREQAPGTKRVPFYRRVDRCGVAFVLISLLFGVIFAFITPPFWGHDEISHFGRAYQIDHGQVLPKRIPDPRGVAYGGKIPSNVKELTNYAFNDYHKPRHRPDPRVTDPHKYEQLQSQPLRSPPVNQWFTNTSAYSPVPYIPSIIGLRIAETAGGTVGTTILLMRIFNLLAYTAIVWLALRALRESRFKWVAFVAALIPIGVFQAGNITADTMTNALAILFGALFVKATFLRRPLSRAETGMLLASAILLPITKPAYLILALLLPFTPRARLALRRWSGTVLGLGTAVSVAAFGVWTYLSAGTSAGMGLMRPKPQWHSVVPGDQVNYVLTHVPHFLRIFLQTFFYKGDRYFDQFFGKLGFAQTQVPAIAIMCCILAGVIAFGMCGRLRATRPRLAATIVLVVVSVLGIFGALYMEFSPVGYYIIDGVQGRYFVPLIVVAVAALLQLIPLRLHLPSKRMAHGSAVAVVALMFFALAASAVKYDYVIWH